MKRYYLFIVLLLICIKINAQQWEAPRHCTLYGEKPGLKEINVPDYSFIYAKSNLTIPLKNSINCIDTLYKVRYSNVFTDVNDWDSAYFISGYTHNERHYVWDSVNPALLTTLKLDYSGNVIWTRTDSVMSGDHFSAYNTSIIKLSDGNFLQIGFVNNDYIHPKKYDWRAAVYTKFNTNGNIIWQKVYKDTAYLKSGDWPQDVIPENDGGFTVSALIASDSKTYSTDTLIDFWYTDTTYVGFIRYDSLGNIVNRKRHFIGGQPINRSIGLLKKEDDGGYIVGGVNLFNGNNNPFNYYLLKVDSNFNWEWKKLFSQTACNLSLMEIIPFSNDMSYFAVNRADTPITYDAYGVKYYTSYYHIGIIDSAYNIVSDTIFKMYLTDPPSIWYYDAGHLQGAALPKNNNGIVVCSDVGYGANMIYLDKDFNFNWNRWIADFPYFTEELYRMRRAHDGGYLIVGRSYRQGVGGWFVKTDTNGFSLPNGADTTFHIGIKEYTNSLNSIDFRTYPNPAKDHIVVEVNQNTKDAMISFFNIQGQLMKQQTIGKQTTEIDIRNLAKGLYFIKLNTAEESVVRKFVKE
jgi:hypothetical protein